MTSRAQSAASFLALLLAAQGAAGCAGLGEFTTPAMRPETYPHIPPDLRLVPLDSVALDARCSAPGGVTDGGVATRNGAHYQGCYFPDWNTIFYDPYNPCIKHELCHASGRSPLDCATVVCEK
jgi:hypothetical protein